jgi:hypothetical protein
MRQSYRVPLVVNTFANPFANRSAVALVPAVELHGVPVRLVNHPIHEDPDSAA